MTTEREVEAVARAISGLRAGGGETTVRRYAAQAITELDRVRDARGDDETVCPRCQGTGKDPCGFGSPDPWVCMTCGGSRSPQGEDHGPEPDALGGLPPSQPKEDDERRH